MSFNVVIIGILLLALSYGAYEYFRISPLLQSSKLLVKDALPLNREGGAYPHRLLVVGDSTAVGVGAPSDASTPARVGDAIAASIENYAVSGAHTSDVTSQLANATHDTYDLVLIQVGANDVLSVASLSQAKAHIKDVLAASRKLSDRVVLLTAGKIGDAPMLPTVIRPIVNARAKELRDVFLHTAREYEVEYIDLYTLPDPFSSEPERYYADDFLHLSGQGYAVWAEYINEAAQSRWPELYATQH